MKAATAQGSVEQAPDPVEVAAGKVADLTERLRVAQADMDHHDFEPHRLKAAHQALPAAQQAVEHTAWRQATFAANGAYNAARLERDVLQTSLVEAGLELRRAQEAAARPGLEEARVLLREAEDHVRRLAEEHAGLNGRNREAVQAADIAGMAAVEQRREALPREQYAAEVGRLRRLEDVCILEAEELAGVPPEMAEAVTLAEANLARAQEQAAAAQEVVAYRKADAADLRRRANDARRARLLMVEERSRPPAPVVRSLRPAAS